jgi:hypothetical protein
LSSNPKYDALFEGLKPVGKYDSLFADLKPVGKYDALFAGLQPATPPLTPDPNVPNAGGVYPPPAPWGEPQTEQATFAGEAGRGIMRFGMINVPKIAGGFAKMQATFAAMTPHTIPVANDPNAQVMQSDRPPKAFAIESQTTRVPPSREQIIAQTGNDPLFQWGEDVTSTANYRLRDNPKLQSLPDAKWEGWSSITNPAVLGRLIGEGVPTAVLAGGSAALTTWATKNPVAGAQVAASIMYVMESGSAYNDAEDAGLPPDVSAGIAHRVGVINATIEQASLAPLFKSLGLTKGATEQIKGKVTKELLKRSQFRNIPKSALEQMAYEGSEEVLQELVSINEMNLALPADQQVTGDELIDRLSEAFVGGALPGLGMGAGAGGWGVRGARKEVSDLTPAPFKTSNLRDNTTSGGDRVGIDMRSKLFPEETAAPEMSMAERQAALDNQYRPTAAEVQQRAGVTPQVEAPVVETPLGHVTR